MDWFNKLSLSLCMPINFLPCRIWFYWGCNPLSYAQKGMAINEFRAPRWQEVTVGGGSSETVGDAVLAQRGLPRNGYNRVLAFFVLVRQSCLHKRGTQGRHL